MSQNASNLLPNLLLPLINELPAGCAKVEEK